MSTTSSVTAALLVVVTSTICAQAPAPIPKPTAEHAKLAAFLGKWSAEAQAQASPFAPAGKFTSTDTGEWLPGNFFLVIHSDGRQAGVEFKSVSILGYDSANKLYTSHYFDNWGNTTAGKGSVQGNTWTWTTDGIVSGKPFKERSTLVVSGDTITQKAEYLADGSTWKLDFEGKSTRVK